MIIKKEPTFIKLLKMNCLLLYCKIISISGIIVSWTRRGPIATKLDVLLNIYCWTTVLITFIIFTIILEIIIIKITNKQYPLSKKAKIYFIVFNFFYSGFLLSNYLQYKKWTYKEYIEEQKYRIKIFNEFIVKNKIENVSLTSIYINEANLKYYKYLQEKYKNITIILADENTEKYIIGKKLNKEDFLKNYLIVEINLKYYNFWWNYLWIRTWCCWCMFSLTDIKHIPRLWFGIRRSRNNYYKFFRTIKGMTHWIRKHFPQFNKINN